MQVEMFWRDLDQTVDHLWPLQCLPCWVEENTDEGRWNKVSGSTHATGVEDHKTHSPSTIAVIHRISVTGPGNPESLHDSLVIRWSRVHSSLESLKGNGGYCYDFYCPMFRAELSELFSIFILPCFFTAGYTCTSYMHPPYVHHSTYACLPHCNHASSMQLPHVP